MLRMEDEIAAKVHRMRELHEKFSQGHYQEMNDNYSDHFIGRLYMPAEDKVLTFTGEEIKQGNQQAADYYHGKELKFI
ncbi:hypothetical protein [Sediminibacillus halophilus]|uniref:Uncharacterized protein n=1 Tax=Sediminibacillus halophilus TaxID=482461 RepID=A0A1G9NEL4_9BACI|nr:hypothetical protein [Sediminibacillus halophilus]SDL84909.1 hypothetical protein SAMN05216244_0967 [Sediminibacillus halophilus]